MLCTSNPPGNFERKNKGAKNKEPGRGRKGSGGKGELPLFGSGRRPSPPAAPGSALPARHGARPRRLLSGDARGWPWALPPGSEPPHGPCQGLLGVWFVPGRAAPAPARAFPAGQPRPGEGPHRASSAASPAGGWRRPVPRDSNRCPPHSRGPRAGAAPRGGLRGFWGQLENSEQETEAKQPSRFAARVPLPSQQR